MPGTSWVKAANVHLTLKFLGDVEDRLVGAIGASLMTAAASVEVFDLTIRGLGAFPTLARPRVIWVGASGPGLGALVESVERALEPLGFPRETRPFSAHVTLGRVRAGARDRRVSRHMSAEEDRGVPRGTRGTPSARGAWGALSRPPIISMPPIISTPPILITRIVLMRSQLSPRGASYTELAAAPLAPPR
jgi:2'-5' RNA ligase